MNSEKLKILMENDLPWSTLFREILAETTPENRGRMFLFNELRRNFHLQVETLSLIGGWNFWEDGGYDDEVLTAKLEGKLLLKDK